jgi:hypothetical protein
MVGRFYETGCERAGLAVLEERVLFGSNPSLYRGQDGVAAYFNALPRWRSRSAEFTDVRAAQAGPDLINMAATASFVLDEGAVKLSAKITWVIVREHGDWKIVSHHVSSKGL